MPLGLRLGENNKVHGAVIGTNTISVFASETYRYWTGAGQETTSCSEQVSGASREDDSTDQ